MIDVYTWTRSYNLRSFQMDIKSVVQTAGIEGRPVGKPLCIGFIIEKQSITARYIRMTSILNLLLTVPSASPTLLTYILTS